MSDYGFVHDGTVYTPNQTTGIPAAQNEDRNKAIESAELAYWQGQPDRFLAHYDTDKGTVSTWLGTVVGRIIAYRVYRHNFGGQFVYLKVQGSNGTTYHGRASYDWGTCVTLRKFKRQ